MGIETKLIARGTIWWVEPYYVCSVRSIQLVFLIKVWTRRSTLPGNKFQCHSEASEPLSWNQRAQPSSVWKRHAPGKAAFLLLAKSVRSYPRQFDCLMSQHWTTPSVGFKVFFVENEPSCYASPRMLMFDNSVRYCGSQTTTSSVSLQLRHRLREIPMNAMRMGWLRETCGILVV